MNRLALVLFLALCGCATRPCEQSAQAVFNGFGTVVIVSETGEDGYTVMTNPCHHSHPAPAAGIGCPPVPPRR